MGKLIWYESHTGKTQHLVIKQHDEITPKMLQKPNHESAEKHLMQTISRMKIHQWALILYSAGHIKKPRLMKLLKRMSTATSTSRYTVLNWIISGLACEAAPTMKHTLETIRRKENFSQLRI